MKIKNRLEYNLTKSHQIKEPGLWRYSINIAGGVFDSEKNRYVCNSIGNFNLLFVRLWNSELGRIKTYYVHKLLFCTLTGALSYSDRRYVVFHKDGNKFNNRLSNLCMVDRKRRLNDNLNVKKRKSKEYKEGIMRVMCGRHYKTKTGGRAIKIYLFKKGGEFVKKYESIRQFCDEFDTNIKAVHRCLAKRSRVFKKNFYIEAIGTRHLRSFGHDPVKPTSKYGWTRHDYAKYQNIL